MAGPRRRLTASVIAGVVLVCAASNVHAQRDEIDPLSLAYTEHCSVCHGEHLQGTALGTPLVGVALRYGDAPGEIGASIANGSPTEGMPGWSEILPETEIKNLAIYIADLRANIDRWDNRRDVPLEIPEGTVASELHDFRNEAFASGPASPRVASSATRDADCHDIAPAGSLAVSSDSRCTRRPATPAGSGACRW